jgi:hypothetical protein
LLSSFEERDETASAIIPMLFPDITQYYYDYYIIRS